MSGGVVAATILKEWHGKGASCPEVMLSLGRCCPVVEVESAAKSRCDPICGGINKTTEAADDEAASGCMTEEDSTSSPPKPIIPFMNSCVLNRMGSGFSVISGESVNNNEISKRLEAGKLPSSHYKGVVPQPNGRWGAQIYEKHQRVWLGTFNSQEEAAKAYDRAALRFRGRDAMTNFVPLDESHPEALFLRRHSKAEIVDMLRKHTYEDEFELSTRNDTTEVKDSSTSHDPDVPGSNPAAPDAAFPREHLFEKAVTPSDVGKLNRLVIPKHHAENYFPLDVASSGKGVLLNFEDDTAKTWRFRYSYWNSSQSYVLTKGWSRYVKDKRLQAGDVVAFERCTGASGKLYISFCRRPCNVVTDFRRPAVSGGFFRPQQFVGPLAGYGQWTQVLYSAPPVWQRDIGAADGSSYAYDFCRLPSPVIKVDDGNSSPAEIVNQKTENSDAAAVAASVSSVKLFGVNLCRPTCPPLNLFPQEKGNNDCEYRGEGKKRKAAESLLSYGGKECYPQRL